jgi:membrane-associated protein
MIDIIKTALDFILHIDVNLQNLVAQYGTLVYGILFLIIFAETGLVATPILPGDSLLFAAGAVAAGGALNPHLIVALLVLAPLCGDNTNYWIGRWLGPKVFSRPKSLFFNPAHLNRTHEFYEKHGTKMIIIARFLPIIRTFAPFVAGIGRMRYLKFLCFSVIGALLWVPTFVYCGYFFGNVPIIKKNFTLVILAIIVISGLPALREFVFKRYFKKQNG